MRALRVKSLHFVRRILIILFLFTFVGCDKEIQRIDDYMVEFATVIKQSGNYSFKLDNGTILTPQEDIKFKSEDGIRVILNWVPSNSNIVKINSVSPIYTGKVQNSGYPESYFKEPIKIQSIWIGGDYLNMIYEIEYNSLQHKISLLRDMDSNYIDLYFSHSRNNDPRGYPKMIYSSFLLSDIRDAEIDGETPFNLYINTDKGLRKIQLTLK